MKTTNQVCLSVSLDDWFFLFFSTISETSQLCVSVCIFSENKVRQQKINGNQWPNQTTRKVKPQGTTPGEIA